MITHEDVEHIFRYHVPNAEKQIRYGILRDAARNFAHIIIDTTKEGPDQSAAIRKLRECVMTANASIALE